MGNGTEVKSCKVKNEQGLIMRKSGRKVRQSILWSVVYTDTVKCNLFSLIYMIKKEWAIHGDDNGITITKDGIKIHFNIKIMTNKGYLFVMTCIVLDDKAETVM